MHVHQAPLTLLLTSTTFISKSSISPQVGKYVQSQLRLSLGSASRIDLRPPGEIGWRIFLERGLEVRLAFLQKRLHAFMLVPAKSRHSLDLAMDQAIKGKGGDKPPTKHMIEHR